ncbi:phosphoglucan phosphatase LSF1, chloroplastic isoform X1 [Canna indica]|uniref:Phosphoglucan phosphatase LSF1, chloroplastic isoform X1 n=1 Tax=Canna indica TaxID=4628 RepID=A0AAQ3KWT1_9LILI|nr:phosphoglucan phosphatase LSF1, chloroplastic isoform X1 [Canna indica]
MALLLQFPHCPSCSSFGERYDWLAALSSSWIRDGSSFGRVAKFSAPARKKAVPMDLIRVSALADQSGYKMNLNEYMVTLEQPLGIRFALSADGRIFVHSLKQGGNAEKSRIVMVGDALKKASNVSSGEFADIKDMRDAKVVLKEISGSFSLVLERPFSPYPIQKLHKSEVVHTLFNKGKVAFATWNKNVLMKDMQPSTGESGNSGFALFCPKFLNSAGWMLLSAQGSVDSLLRSNRSLLHKRTDEIICILSEEESENVEWAYGSFPLEEYIKALDRAKGELYYNHSLGMQYSKITEHIYVGSCIQTEKDVELLSDVMGVTAVLNFQSESERANWGINSESINDSCRRNNILMVNYPVREVDSLDLRKKLPFCVGLLLRLLRKNFKIFVTCTTGFDRSPACVIAYLHWIQDTALHAAFNFVTGLHTCRPDRAAIVWATWDLIAMVENGTHDGPPTHAVNFVWNNGCREGDEVFLIGDFTNNWKESIKAVHKGGSRFEAELRLPHGKYHYKFIVNGQWKHSPALPAESDEHGNVNNVIRVGDTARIRPSSSHFHIKDPTIVKVIERPLTEDERFMLAFAARRIAFAICPVRLAPK